MESERAALFSPRAALRAYPARSANIEPLLVGPLRWRPAPAQRAPGDAPHVCQAGARAAGLLSRSSWFSGAAATPQWGPRGAARQSEGRMSMRFAGAGLSGGHGRSRIIAIVESAAESNREFEHSALSVAIEPSEPGCQRPISVSGRQTARGCADGCPEPDYERDPTNSDKSGTGDANRLVGKSDLARVAESLGREAQREDADAGSGAVPRRAGGPRRRPPPCECHWPWPRPR